MTFRDSRDNKVREDGIKTRSGQKLEAAASLVLADGNLKLKDIVGAPCMGRQGLGLTHFREWGKANPVERRAMIQAEVRGLEEEWKKAKVVGLGSQGAWTRAIYDTLPTPVNLHRWGIRDEPRLPRADTDGAMTKY
ncbi:hypothetical protein ROHU_009273 [Labeo rohita]|uniref:Uncharacterized protein n=1 Tax=Labeo rohita TaxID=84645 RepID=A0A498LZJ6_LABRO|nr:hypothetical protein ROHU_009273 [Labeo rohita]